MHNNEMKKTGLFVGVAVFLGLVALLTTPGRVQINEEEKIGDLLFPAFTAESTRDLTSLEIVRFDSSKAEAVTFRVAQVGDEWRIPSKENYPADADKQLGEVAAQLLNLKALSVALTSGEAQSGDLVGMHRKFGVIDPSGKSLGMGDGVGTRITLRSKGSREPLLDVIVGNEVPDNSALRYVRIADQDPVYTTEVSLRRITTDFGDWIERNPLALDAMDIARVTIADYFLEDHRIQQGPITYITKRSNMRDLIELAYDDFANPRWTFLSNVGFTADRRPMNKPLAENEELNLDKLNAMRRALSGLRIVDIATKPKNLADSLAERGAISLDETAEQSLAGRGFYIGSDPNDPNRFTLQSNQGETMVSMKNGVQYIIRFGELTGAGESAVLAAEDSDDSEKKSGGLHRYLFIMAAFDPTIVAQPELKPLPDLPEADEENDIAAITAERERIERENQRVLEDYQKTIEEGKQRVAELNRRFAPWYFVIDESVYEEIRLTRDDVIREKSAEGSTNGHAGSDDWDSFQLPPLGAAGPSAVPTPPENSFEEFEALRQAAPN